MGINVDDRTNGTTIWAEIKWASKDSSLQTPNLVLGSETLQYTDELGNVKEKAVPKYAVPPGEKKNLSITGIIQNVSVFQKPGYNDRDKAKKTGATPEKNQWDLCIRLADSLSDKTLPVYALHTVMKTDTEQLDANAASLLNLLCAHTKGVEEGKIPAEMPIKFEFYQTPAKNKDGSLNGYFNKNVKLLAPTGFNEESGTWEFNDPTNSIKSADMPVRREPEIVNGKHREFNGIKLYNYDKMFEWMEPRVAYVTGFYKKADQNQSQQQIPEQAPADIAHAPGQQAAAGTSHVPDDDEGVDLGHAIDDAFDMPDAEPEDHGSQRPRMTA